MLNAIILSERESFVDQGIDVIKKLKKFKSRILDWKVIPSHSHTHTWTDPEGEHGSGALENHKWV